MENPDAYRAGKELVEFEWRQNHRNYYSCFSLKFYQENDMPLLTGWFPSQSGDDEVRESGTDAFSNPIPWQLTWVQWFELQNMLAETDLPEYRKPSSDAVDETDSEIRVVWRTDDGGSAAAMRRHWRPWCWVLPRKLMLHPSLKQSSVRCAKRRS